MQARARARWAHAIAATLTSGTLVVARPVLGTRTQLLLVLVASALVLDLVRREVRDPGQPAPIVCCSVALLALAVATPPRFSQDLWAYAMVGRIFALHHASPYLNTPHAFAADPFVRPLGSTWPSVTTPYGPLFVVHAGLIALLAQSHALLYRFAFQGSAAAAVGGAMWATWRETRQTSGLALIGLHPVVACSVVNGGHNDALVGLGLLLAVVATRHERYGAGGCLVAAAALVKVTAGLAVFPLLAWSFARGGRRAVRSLIAPCLLAAGFMLAIPGLLHSVRSADEGVISRTSVWNIPLRTIPNLLPAAPRVVATPLVFLAFASIMIVVAFATLRSRYARDPAPGVVAAVASWVSLAAYVLPWYVFWALPTAALRPRARLTVLVMIQGALAAAAYVVPQSALPEGGPITDLVRVFTPIAFVALLVWALAGLTRERAVTDDLGSLAAV